MMGYIGTTWFQGVRFGVQVVVKGLKLSYHNWYIGYMGYMV